MPALEPQERANLRWSLLRHFSVTELKDIAFTLGVDHESFSYTNKRELGLELIAYFERRDMLGCLLTEALSRHDDLVFDRLLNRVPLCPPRARVLIALTNDRVDRSEFVAALAKLLDIAAYDVSVLGMSGKTSLLVGLPREAADRLLTATVKSFRNGQYRVRSIVPFDDLPAEAQAAWRTQAVDGRPERAGLARFFGGDRPAPQVAAAAPPRPPRRRGILNAALLLLLLAVIVAGLALLLGSRGGNVVVGSTAFTATPTATTTVAPTAIRIAPTLPAAPVAAPTLLPSATRPSPSATPSATPTATRPAPSATPSATPTATQPPPTDTATATSPPPTATATATAPPPPPTAPPCRDDARFVADVTIADGTRLAPGVQFQKTWRIQNTGTCAWTTAYELVYVEGAQLGGQPAIRMAPVAPGAGIDFWVAMVAPTTTGAYRGVWRLRNPAGQLFGETLIVSIVVAQPTVAPRPVFPTAVPTEASPAATTEPPPPSPAPTTAP